MPFFAVGSKAASPIVEVVAAKDAAIPALIRDLPTDPIALPADLPPVVPLQVNDEVSRAGHHFAPWPQKHRCQRPHLAGDDRRRSNQFSGRPPDDFWDVDYLVARSGGDTVGQ